MMNFRTIKSNIISILETAAAGRYEVVQSQRQKQGAKDINSNKKVIVYFYNDQFSNNAGSTNGEVQSEVTFRIHLEVSSKGKFTDLTDPGSLKSAELVADDDWDEFAETIYQILMDARNMDLGMTVGNVANRYITNIQKDDINNNGENVVMVGRMDLTCITPESVPGDDGVDGSSVYSSMEINGDTESKTGITVAP